MTINNFEYGYVNAIKGKVAGKASGQLTPEELTKANRYASDIINVEFDTPEGVDIHVNQTNGEITGTAPFANAISSIADKLGAQLLRGNFNEQEVKTKLEWQQAMDELAKIKMSMAKIGGVVVSSKTIAGSTPSTYPSNPNAAFISGVRKPVTRWL